MNISWKKARTLLNEADVLLFRAGKFPDVGWWIGKYTHSTYSHVGLAHKPDYNDWGCVEFREFRRSRFYPLEQYITYEGAKIDVFRPVQTVTIPYIDEEYQTLSHTYKFSSQIAHDITNTALELIGKPYSYWTIWQIFKTYVPFVRLRTQVIKNGTPDHKRFVCSTLVTYAYRTHFIDPVPFLSDEYTTPGDLARSGLFSYLFSIIS